MSAATAVSAPFAAALKAGIEAALRLDDERWTRHAVWTIAPAADDLRRRRTPIAVSHELLTHAIDTLLTRQGGTR